MYIASVKLRFPKVKEIAAAFKDPKLEFAYECRYFNDFTKKFIGPANIYYTMENTSLFIPCTISLATFI